MFCGILANTAYNPIVRCLLCVCTVYTTHRLLKYSEHWLTDLITNIFNYCNSYAHKIIVKTVWLWSENKVYFTTYLLYFAFSNGQKGGSILGIKKSPVA